MAITRVINVDVNTGDANAELEKLEGSFKEVDKAAEKTNKSVDDVAGNGGAIAILDQLTGGLATRFKDAYEASKLFNLSLKGTRTALISTGIGAFVVALGLVVAYWDEIVELITGANEQLQKNIDLSKEAAADLEVQLGFNEQILKSLNLQGASNKRALETKKKIVIAAQLELIAQNTLLASQLQKEKSKGRELTLAQKLLAFSSGQLFTESKATDEQLAAQKEIADQINANQKAIIDYQLLLNQLDGDAEEDAGDGRDKLEKVKGLGFDAEKSQADFEAREQEYKDRIAQLLDFSKESEDIINTSAQINSDNELKWANLTAEAKLGIASAVLTDAAQLVDKNSVAGKGIAIAQTGINTAQGIMQAFATLPTIAAIPAAAIVGALGIKQTLEIAKRKIPSATGRGFVSGGASGAGAGGTSAPSFNLVEGTSENQVAESIGQGQEPVQAYVVSGDVTTAQNLDNNIVTESGI